ncbi:cell wall hydrolase [Qipengyuania sp. CAU 1752]
MNNSPAPQPPRFAFQRRRRGLRALFAGKRSKALVALAAAVTFPAFAAPAQWTPFGDAAEAATRAATPQAMPFEQAGMSFPGSAFYYLEDAPRLAFDIDRKPVGDDAGGQFYNPLEVMSGDPSRAVEVRDAGPAARAFGAGGSGLDMARALQCLASAVYYEAASESIGGQKAVAQVVLNRVAHPTYPRSVCGVVYQGSERSTGCQFSFTCDGSLARKPSTTAWARAMRVAREALAGDVYAPVGFATHYHTTWVSPYWAPSLDFIGTIGAHRFYRWRGAAGKPSAFSTTYIGGEPLPRPRARTAETESAGDALDPAALARSFEEARSKAAGSLTTRAAAPRYTPAIEAAGGDAQFRAEKLPQSGTVRDEFARAGQWKEQP